jgi:hypothetical protein
MDCLTIISDEKHSDLSSSSSEHLSRLKHSKTTKKRGPRYTRINEKSKPFLKRLVGTIFGDYGGIIKNKKRRNKKTLLPSKSKIEKQFEENEQTLNSLVTLLTEIESTNNHSIEKEQARNNNRIDDTSNASFHSRPKHSHLSFQSSRKMIDNQQQTQLYPTKITIGTSTQLHDSSWLDVIHDDQTTSNAWARIRRRLKPNEQKDILR